MGLSTNSYRDLGLSPWFALRSKGELNTRPPRFDADLRKPFRERQQDGKTLCLPFREATPCSAAAGKSCAACTG